MTLSELIERCSVKHIRQEGSRRHVLSYALYDAPRKSVAVTWCSEPFCEYNGHALEAVSGAGLDPIKHFPSAERLSAQERDDGR